MTKIFTYQTDFDLAAIMLSNAKRAKKKRGKSMNGSVTFAEARAIMSAVLKDDEDLRKTYRANIAMCIDDELNIGHKKRNELAEKLINLIWG